MIKLARYPFSWSGLVFRKLFQTALLLGLMISIAKFAFPAPPSAAKSVANRSVSYGTCIDKADGIDGAMERCTDEEIAKLNMSIDELTDAKSSFVPGQTEPYVFDERRWNEFVVGKCQEVIRQDTGVSSYQEYGSMDRMLYKMCVLDQTKSRLGMMASQAASKPK